MLNSALLHSTLGQCEEISDCSYTGQTFLQKRNINNVSQLDQGTTDQEEEAGAVCVRDLRNFFESLKDKNEK